MPLVAVVDGRRALASTDGARRAACVDCGREMIAKTGEVVTHHWAHRHAADAGCGAGETDWHLSWKARCTELARVEVTRGQRRADVLTPYGWAVEFQHSPLTPTEVGRRETDWGRNMIWVFDLRDAADGVRLEYWRPDGRHHHTLRWAWSKAFVIAAKVPTFVHATDDTLFMVGRWFDKKPSKPIQGYGWKLTADEFAEHVINGIRPPRTPGMGQPLDPRVWSHRRVELNCPACGQPLAQPSRCSAAWAHGVAA